jgi:hypothetical protein
VERCKRREDMWQIRLSVRKTPGGHPNIRPYGCSTSVYSICFDLQSLAQNIRGRTSYELHGGRTGVKRN